MRENQDAEFVTMKDESLWVSVKLYTTKKLGKKDNLSEDGYAPDMFGFRLPYKQFCNLLKSKEQKKFRQDLLKEYPQYSLLPPEKLEIVPSMPPPRVVHPSVISEEEEEEEGTEEYTTTTSTKILE